MDFEWEENYLFLDYCIQYWTSVEKLVYQYSLDHTLVVPEIIGLHYVVLLLQHT